MESHVSTDLVAHSGRLQLAINELNYHFARLTSGVSQDKAESTLQDADQHSDHHLFADEYLSQDFLYCGRVLLYHTERSLKAPSQAEYKNLTGKISSNAEYSFSLLETCTGKLGLKDTTVLHTPPAKATTDYKNFVVGVAENVKYDWVVTLVAMVPCIQSYYKIAVDIRDYKPTPDKTTLWYVNWVEPNLKYESSIKKQIQFFKDHAAEWKKATYTDLRKIFHDACQREIDLWAVAK
ncbi:hypothetical protein BC826DRAFT_1181419 [Russula brevipes]|nr:hypothetical protein BC826DRAFT_1181419 [Russula brevipes]